MSETSNLSSMPNSKIAIIGLGYVGLPLAIEFAKKYDVLGYDIDDERVVKLRNGEDRTREADLNDLKKVIKPGHSQENGLYFSSNKQDLKECNILL